MSDDTKDTPKVVSLVEASGAETEASEFAIYDNEYYEVVLVEFEYDEFFAPEPPLFDGVPYTEWYEVHNLGTGVAECKTPQLPWAVEVAQRMCASLKFLAADEMGDAQGGLQ